MATTQYVGARYVPEFADPAEWSSDLAYEPLTIVIHEGNSYTSKQFVPKGIDIDNDKFWALTGNYNAQVEGYRKEVMQYNERINDANINANTALQIAKNASNKTDLRDVCLFFGDSWTADSHHNPVPNNDGSWVKSVADSLGCDYKIFATAGALLSGTANIDFTNQITSAISTVTDIPRVKWIIVLGGANDYQSVNTVTPQSFQDGVYNQLTRLKTHYTHAKIVFVPMNMFYLRCGYSNNPGIPNVTIPGERYTLFVYMCENLVRRFNANVIYLKNFAEYFRYNGQDVYRPNDDSSYTDGGGTIHPNIRGNRIIADFIINGIYGNGYRYPLLNMSSVNDAVTIDQNHCQFNGSSIIWNLQFTTRNMNVIENTFIPLFKIMNEEYPRVISDSTGDASGFHYLGEANCVTEKLNVKLYVRDITKLNEDNAQVYMFTSSQFSGNKGFCVNAVTEIMGA